MKHYNATISADVNRIFGLKGESIAEIENVIVPTINIFPKINNYNTTQNNLNGNSTIYTTPTDADFYLTSVQLSRTKDVTADTTSSSIRVTIDGVSKSILYMSGLTLTAQEQDIFLNFSIPIKLDRGTTIVINSSRTAGNTNHSATITGFVMQTLSSGGI